MNPLKVVYTLPRSTLFYHKIFDDKNDAIAFLEGKPNALLFELDMEGAAGTSWKMLPFGDYRAFNIGFFIKNHLLEITLLLSAVGYMLYRNFSKTDSAPAPAASSTAAKSAQDNEPAPKLEPINTNPSNSN